MVTFAIINLEMKLIRAHKSTSNIFSFRSGQSRIIYASTTTSIPCLNDWPPPSQPWWYRMRPQHHHRRWWRLRRHNRRRRGGRGTSPKTHHQTLLQLHGSSRSDRWCRLSAANAQHAHFRRNLLPKGTRSQTFTVAFHTFALVRKHSNVTEAITALWFLTTVPRNEEGRVAAVLFSPVQGNLRSGVGGAAKLEYFEKGETTAAR